MRNRRALYASVLALSALSGSALAGSAGLVVETNGAVSAAITPYTEVAPGSDLALGSAGNSIVIVHYATCRQVDAAGGTLTVNAVDYAIHDGQITSEAQQACPKNVKINQTTAIAGGLVMR